MLGAAIVAPAAMAKEVTAAAINTTDASFVVVPGAGYTFTAYQRRAIIHQALRMAGVLKSGQSASQNQYEEACFILNEMLNYWQSRGIELRDMDGESMVGNLAFRLMPYYSSTLPYPTSVQPSASRPLPVQWEQS